MYTNGSISTLQKYYKKRKRIGYGMTFYKVRSVQSAQLSPTAPAAFARAFRAIPFASTGRIATP